MKRLRHEVGQHGAVAVLVALLLIVLIGAAGIVIDLGRLFVVKTELQNAVDACALAAARELNVPSKTSAVLTRAENAGIEVGNMHFSDFQHDPVVFETEQDVTFGVTPNWRDGSYATKGKALAEIEYVRCTRQVTGILPTLMQLLGVGSNSVSATAVASLQGGITSCPIPLAMCKEAVTPFPLCKRVGAVQDPDSGLCEGQWYSGGLGQASVTGNFNWIDYSPHAGGASEVEAHLAGFGVCDVEVGGETVHAETGNMQSLKDAWNSRFGLYNNKFNVDTAVPDFTGYAYGANNSSKRDTYADYLDRRDGYVPYQDDDLTVGPPEEIDTDKFTRSSSSEHRRGADRRVVTMPVVDCSTWGPKHQAAVVGWACALMVQPWPPQPKDPLVLEYLGPANASGAACASYGQSGGPGGTGPKVPTLVQ